MIPPFVNDLIYMLKDSAIISVIGGAEITTDSMYGVIAMEAILYLSL